MNNRLTETEENALYEKIETVFRILQLSTKKRDDFRPWYGEFIVPQFSPHFETCIGCRLETRGARKGKITFSAYAVGVKIGDQKEHIYFERGEKHEITVSGDRDAHKIADEIKRRLYPGAFEYWKGAAIKAQAIIERFNKLSKVKTALMVLGACFGNGETEGWFSNPHCDFRLSYEGDRLEIRSAYIDPAKIAEILKLLNKAD